MQSYEYGHASTVPRNITSRIHFFGSISTSLRRGGRAVNHTKYRHTSTVM